MNVRTALTENESIQKIQSFWRGGSMLILSILKRSHPLWNWVMFLAFSVFLISCGFSSKQEKVEKDNSTVKDTLSVEIEKLNEPGKIVGFSVAMVDTTGILFNKGFGLADLATGKSYTTKTTQYVASISKTLIGISLFKAQELGKLNIDEPINKYLPFDVANPNFPEIPITIRQLAIHTSSITDSDRFWESDYLLLQKNQPEGTGIPKYFNAPKNKEPISGFLSDLLAENRDLNKGDNFTDHSPNQKFVYSNVGSTLCALIIEIATGMPYQTFTKKYILEPLKMDASGWSIEHVDSNHRSILYVTHEQVMADYTTVSFPSGGLITSSADLGKYLSELIRGYSGKGRILTTKSYEELFRKQLIKSQLPEGVEANVGIFMDYSKRGLGYSGYDPGLMAYMYFNPENLIGKIITINTDTDFDEEVRPTLNSVWELLGNYETKLN